MFEYFGNMKYRIMTLKRWPAIVASQSTHMSSLILAGFFTVRVEVCGWGKGVFSLSYFTLTGLQDFHSVCFLTFQSWEFSYADAGKVWLMWSVYNIVNVWPSRRMTNTALHWWPVLKTKYMFLYIKESHYKYYWKGYCIWKYKFIWHVCKLSFFENKDNRNVHII